MVHVECVFVAGIHSYRTSLSGSLESVRWNARVHRLDLGLYSHPKGFGGMESETMLTPGEKKSPLREAQRRFEPFASRRTASPRHSRLSYPGSGGLVVKVLQCVRYRSQH